MRTLKGQNLVHDENYALFPEGAIINETEQQEGTPVVREVYNDILMNIYAYLKSRGIAINQQEDNEQNGYQLINALKRNVNELNDVEKLLNLNGSTWNIDLNFSLIPNKYFVFVRATENSSAANNAIKGTGATVIPFESLNGFKTGDELLLIIDTAKVRAYNLSSGGSSTFALSNYSPLFGRPLRFMTSKEKIWYEENGVLYGDYPERYNLQQIIDPNLSILVLEIFEHEGRIICFCYEPSNFEISFYYFSYPDFSAPVQLNFSGSAFNENLTGNRNVHIYFDGEKIGITNRTNTVDDSNEIEFYSADFSNNKLVYQSSATLDVSFEKTTNSVSASGGIINSVNGILTYFKADGTVVDLGNFTNFIGGIFRIKDRIFYFDDYGAIEWKFEL